MRGTDLLAKYIFILKYCLKLPTTFYETKISKNNAFTKKKTIFQDI